jgi:hypothetical protein
MPTTGLRTGHRLDEIPAWAQIISGFTICRGELLSPASPQRFAGLTDVGFRNPGCQSSRLRLRSPDLEAERRADKGDFATDASRQRW